MRFGMGVPKNFVGPRRETRIPMEVGVHITGHPALPGTETTFTENVSPHGARVLSTRRWNAGDRPRRLLPDHSAIRFRCGLGIPGTQWQLGRRGISRNLAGRAGLLHESEVRLRSRPRSFR